MHVEKLSLSELNFSLIFCHTGGRRMSERDMTRVGAESKPPTAGPQLLNSKSVPTLHHIGKRLNKLFKLIKSTREYNYIR